MAVNSLKSHKRIRINPKQSKNYPKHPVTPSIPRITHQFPPHLKMNYYHNNVYIVKPKINM